MTKDPIRTLVAQFSHFIANKSISHEDWVMLTTEYGVHQTAKEQERFFQSWEWGDNDQLQRTRQLFSKIIEDDQEKGLALMKRVYDFVGGADDSEIAKYPALQNLEGERTDVAGGLPTITTELFIDIEHTTDDFYDDLISNINQSYRIGVYDGTFVLTRKLLENLVIELLRNQYGTSYLRMYYIPNQRRFQNFSTLLDGLEYKLKDYQSYSNGLDKELIRDIRQFKNSADADAHSIIRNPDKEEIDDLGTDAEHAAKVMFRVLRNMD
ncbi:hypothetical protein [Haloarcula sediminis]|uniref:hypothetical protein n=1 Tax=Haloarcula sediminis TaxID=3111777 RepID=UPI002D76B72E|nr:hypothetical protein [Haloarcula sp. CK38]